MIMTLPWRRPLLLLLLCVAHALADTPFDCSSVELSGVKYDLTLLHDDRAVVRERQTPPSLMKDELRFNICKDLGQIDGVKPTDQVCGVVVLATAYLHGCNLVWRGHTGLLYYNEYQRWRAGVFRWSCLAKIYFVLTALAKRRTASFL